MHYTEHKVAVERSVSKRRMYLGSTGDVAGRDDDRLRPDALDERLDGGAHTRDLYEATPT